MSASSPASRDSASQYDASGIRAIAIIRRMTSGYDMIRRRRRRGSRPCGQRRGHRFLDHPVAEVRLQFPEPDQVRQPRVRQHRPARGGPPPGAVTTGRQNSASSPERGAVPPATVTVPAGTAGQRPGPRPCPPESRAPGTPAHRCAQAASERSRPGWSPAAMSSSAAVSGPIP